MWSARANIVAGTTTPSSRAVFTLIGEFERRWQLDRQVAGVGAFQNLVHIKGCVPSKVGIGWSVGDQPSDFHVFGRARDRGHHDGNCVRSTLGGQGGSGPTSDDDGDLLLYQLPGQHPCRINVAFRIALNEGHVSPVDIAEVAHALQECIHSSGRSPASRRPMTGAFAVGCAITLNGDRYARVRTAVRSACLRFIFVLSLAKDLERSGLRGKPARP